MEDTNLHIQTPVIFSPVLSEKLQKNIYLKLESLQPTGSYKIRGIGKLCQEEAKKGATEFVSSSGGNAGIAVAYAGKKLGIPVKVFIPETSREIFRTHLYALGADVAIHGYAWDDANQKAQEYLQANGGSFIPPFDHPTLWQGHASLIDELVRDINGFEAIIASVGGGGLACGIMQGLKQNQSQCPELSQVKFIGVETEGTASFKEAIKAGKSIDIGKVNSIATSLGARKVAEQLMNWHSMGNILSTTVEDEVVAKICWQFANDHRVMVEASAAAALSLCYTNHQVIKDFNSLVVVVCGGVGISNEIIQEYKEQFKF